LWLFAAIDGKKIGAAICRKQPPLLYRFTTVYTQFANKIMKRGNYILYPLKQKIMGTINKGILGGFSGKVGTVVGGSWKGINYIRSKGNNRNMNPTDKQLAQQLKFAMVMRFVQPMAALLNISFRHFAIKMTGINNAFSYNLKNAVTGTYPSFEIDYSLALVSRGDLPNALAPAVTAVAGSLLTFSWTDNPGIGKARGTDQAILVAYCPAQRQAIYTTAGGLRSDLKGELNLLPFSGLVVETYIGFISESGLGIATSIFTGEVTVSQEKLSAARGRSTSKRQLKKDLRSA
jgi:hypothetical protein